MSSLVQATPPPLDDRTFPLDVLGDGGVVIKKLSKRCAATSPRRATTQVNYVGRVKGKEDEFDRNHGGYPFEFTVGAGKVVKGWDEAIKVLKVGDAAPSSSFAPDYGYGAEGSEDDVPPGATLVFDMELRQAARAAAEKKATIAAKAGAKSALAEKLANKNKKGGGKKEKKEWKPPEKKEKPAKRQGQEGQGRGRGVRGDDAAAVALRTAGARSRGRRSAARDAAGRASS
ncbi:FK506 binding protein [Aureococcus anophagefferens]|uniref:peptidylprolyl isomerase n=1 Tax=Aureococcus anophagefferens TaxID=44056 RepID=A0ABR1FGT8_AURAN